MSHQPSEIPDSDIDNQPSHELLNSLTFRDAVVRGGRLKCPICGVGALFRNPFRMHAECSNCGFQFHRDEGYFLGSTYINPGNNTSFRQPKPKTATTYINVVIKAVNP